MTDMSLARVGAVVRKDLAELRAGPAVLVAPLFMLLTAVALPVATAVVVPTMFDAPLDDARDLVELAHRAGVVRLDGLSDAAIVQAQLLHQFLPLLALVPVGAAMTLVTTSIVGEKHARTLEPLLATPLTPLELLTGKLLVALTVALTLGVTGVGLLATAVMAAGEPGVARALFSPHMLAMMGGVAPSAALVALALGAIVSTRAKDARSAQQAGTVVVLPLVAAFIAGLNGTLVLTTPLLLMTATVLLLVAAALVLVGARRFDRERILTDWT